MNAQVPTLPIGTPKVPTCTRPDPMCLLTVCNKRSDRQSVNQISKRAPNEQNRTTSLRVGHAQSKAKPP